MAKNIQFDFSDGQTLIVHINEDVSSDVIRKINNTIWDRVSDYYNKNPDPDSDEIVLTAVLDSYAKEFGFTYEFVPIYWTIAL